jgi:hypothetical protein
MQRGAEASWGDDQRRFPDLPEMVTKPDRSGLELRSIPC